MTEIKKDILKEEVLIPGSKSYANRILILASLSEKKLRIKNLNLCDDVLFLMKSLDEIGIEIKQEGEDFLVLNSFPACEKGNKKLFVGEGGTTLRFLLPFLSLGQCEYEIEMADQLASRPHHELIAKLEELNVKIKYENKKIFLQGPRTAKKIVVDSSLSSQFASGLRLSGVDISVENLKNSQSYLMMTEELIKTFPLLQEYQVPGDFSSAAFPIAFAFVNKTSVKLKNLYRDPLQADEKILNFIQRHGATVLETEEGIFIDCGKRDNRGLKIDLSDCLDLAPALAFMASFQEEESLLSGASALMVKESNRLLEIQKLLEHFHIKTFYDERIDQLKIVPQKIIDYKKELITAEDHRMVMTGILFLKSLEGGRINALSAIQKSFPHFLDIFYN